MPSCLNVSISNNQQLNRLCRIADILREMLYNLEIVNKGQYLHVTASGLRSRKTLVSIAEQVLEECIRDSVDDVLFDSRNIEGRISVFDSYQIVTKDFPRLIKIKKINRMAILDAEDNGYRMHFFESVCQKFGFNFRTFTNYEKAEKWISAKELVPAD